jgi:glycosyltransferase involved in cell wall biosynthesis
MKIGIEAQRIFRAHKHGMDRVVLELIRNLQQFDTVNQYFIFVRPDADNTVIQNTANFKIVEVPGGAYPIWEQYELPRAAINHGCDLLHCTSNTAPLFGNIPLVTTVHDIIYLEECLWKQLKSKATAYQKIGNTYRRFVVPYAIKKSKQLITVSEFEKSNIGQRFGNHVTNKLSAVYNGVSDPFKQSKDSTFLEAIRKKYGLPKQYLLFFGSKDPRKNTKRVIKACSRFMAKNNAYGLVLMNYSESDLNDLLSEIGSNDLKDKIVLPGYVSDHDLPGIYTNAKLFLFPSLREGFGIPVLEAMACGTPVITSNSSSMPEVAGNAAHLVNPYDLDAIVNGIEKVLTDTAYREGLVQKGLTQTDLFSWRSMAEKVHSIYEDIYNQNKA